MAIASNAPSMQSSQRAVAGVHAATPSPAPSHAPSPAQNVSAQHKCSTAFGGFTIDTSKFGHWSWRDDLGQLELLANGGQGGQGGAAADRKDRKLFGNRATTKTGAAATGNTLKVGVRWSRVVMITQLIQSILWHRI